MTRVPVGTIGGETSIPKMNPQSMVSMPIEMRSSIVCSTAQLGALRKFLGKDNTLFSYLILFW